jgi:spore coat polysaccharide biosynthesis protein SpsF
VAEAVVIVVQARMGSSRLPGKVLFPFGDTTLLGRVVGRLREVAPIVVATSVRDEDDPLVAECERLGVASFRGDDTDVLGRFAACVESLPARPDIVVRMCADRPLTCPVLLRELLQLHGLTGRPDYLSNTNPSSYPYGLDLELITPAALLAAAAEADEPYDREHVTPFVHRHPERFRAVNVPCPYGAFAGVHTTVDTREHYDALLEVARILPPGDDYRDLLTLASLRPELFP